MAGHSELQERGFVSQQHGFKAVKRQSFVGTGCFDAGQNVVSAGKASAAALVKSI